MFGFTQREFTDHTLAEFLRTHGAINDLIPAFSNELRALRGSLPKELHNLARTFAAGKLNESDSGELLVSLTNALSEFAPPYCYFGAHPGDGADFGFWLFEDFQQSARDDGALEVSDTSEVPEGYSGEVLHINDHGNATLYSAHKGKLTEVWSVV